MLKKIKSPKKCKDCGREAYSYQIGWQDNEGNVHWHPPRHYNQCEKCRKDMYKRICEKRKEESA